VSSFLTAHQHIALYTWQKTQRQCEQPFTELMSCNDCNHMFNRRPGCSYRRKSTFWEDNRQSWATNMPDLGGGAYSAPQTS